MSHARAAKIKQDHKNASAMLITSANAIKEGKNVIVKPMAKMLELKEQVAIHDQTHADSPMNAFANAESQLLNSQSAENVTRSTQNVDLSIENSQKSAEAKS